MSEAQATETTTTATTGSALSQGTAQTTDAAATTTASKFTFPDNWKEGLPEDIRNDGSLTPIKTFEDLAKSYVHAQKMVGKNKVVVPDPKHATDQDWKDFYTKAGLPSDVSQYKLDIPKEAGIDEKFVNEFVAAAHKMNIFPKQAESLLKWYVEKEKEMVTQTADAANAEIEKSLRQYKTKMGAAYDRKIALANKAISEYGSEELSSLLENPALGSNPVMIDFMSKVGEVLFGEDRIDGIDTTFKALSPEEAKTRWNDINADREHPYWKTSHPNHKKAMDEVKQLFTYMYPSR